VRGTIVATMTVLALGFAAFAQLTHGFTALTAETARRNSAAARPIPVPALIGIDQRGQRRPMFTATDDRVAIVDFVYTRCTSICSALGGSFQQLQAAIVAAHLGRTVRLVSVSFDPEHDTPAAIADYAARMRANPEIWTVLTPVDSAGLRSSMQAFGIVAKPAPLGQFVHNATFNVLDRRGRLARIVDIDQPRAALAVAVEVYARP